MLVGVSLHYLLHWPTHGGYNFVSGPLADITLFTAFASGLILFLRRHNCHVHRCWRLQWHPHPESGHPVCKKHHPDGRGIRAQPLNLAPFQIRRASEDDRRVKQYRRASGELWDAIDLGLLL